MTMRVGANLALICTLCGCGDAIEREPNAPDEPRIEQVRGLDEVASRMLAHVPADTPYVWLEAEPLPDAYVARVEPLVSATLAVWGRALEQPIAGDDRELAALAEAFRGHMTPQGLRELGFDTNPRAVLYGIGLAPVLRVQLLDGTKVARLIEQVDAADGDIAVRTIDGHPVWAASAKHGTFAAAIAVVDDELVIAAYPPAVEADVLPLVVGATLPERSLAQTDWLRTARRDHDLLPHGVGSVDLVRVVAILSGEGDATTKAITREWSANLQDDRCADALRGVLARAPRIWFGLREIGARRIASATIWEMDAGLRDELREVAAPIAGLGRSSRDEGLASLAVGVDLAAALAMLERWREDDRLAACGLPGSESAPPPPWVAALHGGSAVLHGWDPVHEKFSGVITIGVDDPRAWLAEVMPTADTRALKRRRPVRAREVVGTGGWVRDGWLARGRHALGFALGDDARKHLRHAVDRERDDGRTLLSWSLDVRGLVDSFPRSALRELLDQRGEVERAWIEAMLDLVDRSTGGLVVGQHGLELGATLEL